MKKFDRTTVESFSISKDDITLNALTFAVVKGNLTAAQYIVNECNINLASTLSIFQVVKPDQQASKDQVEELRMRLHPKVTLKSALDTNNRELFDYILKIGCPLMESECNLIQDFTELISQADNNYKPHSKYIKSLANSSLFVRQLVDNYEHGDLKPKLDKSQISHLSFQEDDKGILRIITQDEEIFKVVKKQIRKHEEVSKALQDKVLLQQIIECAVNDTLHEAKLAHFNEIVNYGLHRIEITNFNAIKGLEKQNVPKEPMPLVVLLIRLNSLKSLKYVLSHTLCDMASLLATVNLGKLKT